MPGVVPSHVQSSAQLNRDVAGYTLEELTPSSPSSTLARELLLEYGHFVASQGNVASFCYGTLEQEAAALPKSYIDQGGGAIIAFANSQPAGFVAWRSFAKPGLSHAWELKRLWLRPNARGLGIGRALVQAVINRALAARKSAILLDTEPQSMASAYRLYQKMDFSECSAYNGSALPGILYMRKNL
jgi:ribosomal protein S18 acetylase RimI-like enzyme